jgi:hypothetical protein
MRLYPHWLVAVIARVNFFSYSSIRTVVVHEQVDAYLPPAHKNNLCYFGGEEGGADVFMHYDCPDRYNLLLSPQLRWPVHLARSDRICTALSCCDDAALRSYPAPTFIDRFINTNALFSNSNLHSDNTNNVYLPENIRLPGIAIEKDLNSSQDIGNGAVRCRFPFSCLLTHKRGVKFRTVST